MSRPDTTRTTTDQVINRRLKDQLVPEANMEMDNYIDSIDSELKQPFRLKADVDGSYQVLVEAVDIQNPETLVHRSRFPIKKKIPDFSGVSIDFPVTSGNPVLVSAGLSENLVLDNDKYCKFLVQINDQGELLMRQGFQADTAEDAKIPKAKSGLTSIGFISLHMGVGGVLDEIAEEDITQFDGHNDTQDFHETLRVREHRSNYKRVEVSGALYDGSDDNGWIRTLEGKKLDFSGALINFETGVITKEDGTTPLGNNFSVPTIPDTFYQYFSINIEPDVINADNEMTAKVTVVPAANPGTTLENAPLADWIDNEKGIRLAQVAVQGTTVGGGIEQSTADQSLSDTDLLITGSKTIAQTFLNTASLNSSKARVQIGNSGGGPTTLTLSGMTNVNFDQAYTECTVFGTRTTAGPNFVEDSNYKMFKYDAGGGNWYVVIYDNDLLDDWSVYETTSDPDTWVDAQGIVLNSGEQITTVSELQVIANAPDSGDANVSYAGGGTATGTYKYAIYATSGGLPTGSALAETTDDDIANLPLGLAQGVAETELSFISPNVLVPGTTYALVIEFTITNGGTVSVAYQTGDAYADGSLQEDNGGWAVISGGTLDAAFEVLGTTLGTPAIENIFDATIIHQSELSSEGEGRRFGVTNVQGLKDIPIYERHHHMLRLVESDLQGRGVLYRWDEFDTSPDSTSNPEIGEAAKIAEPTDGFGRWLTITAMDIGASVVRTDMIRNDNVTLAKLAHTDPHRVIGFNAGGVPSYLFELELTDGTALQPTYSFALDQDTGWYRAGDGSGAYSSNGEQKWIHSWTGTVDTFTHRADAKSINVQALAQDSYIAEMSAHGVTQGTGRYFAGESALRGGGFGYNGDDNPDVSFGRIDAVSFYRRIAGVETEVFWYRADSNIVNFNGQVSLQDNNLAAANPESGYLSLLQDNDTLYSRTSTGVTTPILNQTQQDSRYLRRDANDLPTADNTWTLGSASFRWANIWAVTFQGRATSANYADLAERYEADSKLEPGDIVKLGGSKEITKTISAQDTEVFGVVSTDPAFRMNDNVGDSDDEKPFVALAGRVPCKIKGKIKKGQRLCSSDEAGVAEALDDSVDNWKIVIGRALEDKDTFEVGKIEVVVGTK